MPDLHVLVERWEASVDHLRRMHSLFRRELGVGRFYPNHELSAPLELLQQALQELHTSAMVLCGWIHHGLQGRLLHCQVDWHQEPNADHVLGSAGQRH